MRWYDNNISNMSMEQRSAWLGRHGVNNVYTSGGAGDFGARPGRGSSMDQAMDAQASQGRMGGEFAEYMYDQGFSHRGNQWGQYRDFGTSPSSKESGVDYSNVQFVGDGAASVIASYNWQMAVMANAGGGLKGLFYKERYVSGSEEIGTVTGNFTDQHVGPGTFQVKHPDGNITQANITTINPNGQFANQVFNTTSNPTSINISVANADPAAITTINYAVSEQRVFYQKNIFFLGIVRVGRVVGMYSAANSRSMIRNGINGRPIQPGQPNNLANQFSGAGGSINNYSPVTIWR